MWKFFRDRKGGLDAPARDDAALDSVLAALVQGEAERALPTLVCRECGVTYANTGTYLRGSSCPHCHPPQRADHEQLLPLPDATTAANAPGY